MRIFPMMIVLLACLSQMPVVHAGAAVARQQQLKAQRQQQIQQQMQQAYEQQQVEAYKQAVAEQQAAYQAAQMQAVQQMVMQQAIQQKIQQEVAAFVQAKQIQAVQQEMVKRAAEHELAQRIIQAKTQQIGEQMVYQSVAHAVQQATQQRDQLVVNKVMEARQGQAIQQAQEQAAYQAALEKVKIAQAQLTAAQQQAMAYQQAGALKMAGQGQAQALAQQGYELAAASQMVGGAKALAVGQPYAQVPPEQVLDVVDIAKVWQKLDVKSMVWLLLIDNQAKVATVEEYIDRFRQQKIKINQPAAYYVQLIDQMAEQDAQLLQRPFNELLQLIAIIEYDFDNGRDKDILAHKVLGEEGYYTNKKRFANR